MPIRLALLATLFLTGTARAQTATEYDALVGRAEEANRAERFRESDSLYTRAFEVGSSSASDLYNAACSAARAGLPDQAFARLEQAARAGWEHEPFARIDRDLASLWPDTLRWAVPQATVTATMADRYGPAFDAALRAELADVYETDQRERRQLSRLYRQHTGPARDSVMAEFWALQNPVDSLNAVRLNEIIAERGWPGYRLVGRDGAMTAFLVVQHAPIDMQQRHLPALEAAVAAGDADPANLAFLVDRIRVETGQPQLYGSQTRYDSATGTLGFAPIEDEANVDVRRASVGLDPISEYARTTLGFEYAPPSAVPAPAD